MTSIGLLSDTHYQDRLFGLPARLTRIWAGVSMILHAGDVGDLSVLDELSRIAPVTAVTGNDEPAHVKEILPLQQVVTVHGQRIVLLHSHFTDPEQERATRREHRWTPKLDRLAALGQAAGASVVVYGHTHIPMLVEHGGVTLFNPGALAAGSYFTRQKLPLVGRLEVTPEGVITLSHFDTATGLVFKVPKLDPRADYDLLATQYQISIVEPSLLADIDAMRKITYDNIRGVVAALVPLYRRCLTEDVPIRRPDLIAAIEADKELSAHDRVALLNTLTRDLNATQQNPHV